MGAMKCFSSGKEMGKYIPKLLQHCLCVASADVNLKVDGKFT